MKSHSKELFSAINDIYLNKDKIDIYDLRTFIKYIVTYEEEINSTFFEFIPRMKNYKEIFTEISKPLNKNRKLKTILHRTDYPRVRFDLYGLA